MIKKDSRIVVQRTLCRFFFQYKIHENYCIMSSIFIINNTNQELVGNKKVVYQSRSNRNSTKSKMNLP